MKPRQRKFFSWRPRRLMRQWFPANFRFRLVDWQELASVILLFLVLEIAIRSIEQAQWITPQPSLTLVLILAILAIGLMVKIRLPSPVTHFLALVLGAAVTMWQGANLLPPAETVSRFSQVVTALQSWWEAARLGKPSEGIMHFAVFLVLFTWVSGYVSTWFLLRRQNAWVAAGLGAATVLVNLSNLTEKYYIFFGYYLLAAMLLVGQSNVARHYHQYQKHGIVYPGRTLMLVMTSVLCLSVITVSLVWFTPEIRASKVELPANIPFKKNINDFLTNFFSQVTVQQPYLASSAQRALVFGDPIDRSDTVHFVITSKRPFYWRTRMYDTYTSRGWTGSRTAESLPGMVVPGSETEKLLRRSQVAGTVVPKLKTDILPSAGEFVLADTPVSIRTLAPLSFSISLFSSFRDDALPSDVASLARSLRAARSATRISSLDDIQQRLPANLTLTSIGETRDAPSEANFESLWRSRRLTILEVTRKVTGAGDVVAVVTPQLLNTDQRFKVISGISSASPAELAGAGEKYPHQVTDYYLQLPPGFPERIRQLSKTITREARSPYDKVLAVKQHLSQFPYSLMGESLPEGVDGVDHFLFTRQEGDCFYFASAMAVMLRSVGVPARLIAGYLPGEWDEATGVATIRAKDYHAWTEVYFPGYGWIEFDPTPATSSGEFGFMWEEEISEESTADESQATDGEGITFPELSISLPALGVPTTLLMVALGLVVYRWLRRFTGLDYVSAVYARMCLLASLVRLGPRPQYTPLEYCVRLAAAFPVQAEAISRIGQTYAESRFGYRKMLDRVQRERLQEAWRNVRPALLRRLFRWQ